MLVKLFNVQYDNQKYHQLSESLPFQVKASSLTEAITKLEKYLKDNNMVINIVSVSSAPGGVLE